jgi:hypothetical protein
VSYLGVPRLHFTGHFQADSPTVNNVDPYHNNDLFEPRFQLVQDLPDRNGLFNPIGTGAFRLRGCRVTSVVYPDGRYIASTAEDPIVGSYLAEDNLRVSAKLVDIHPHAQDAPVIYGLRLRLLNGEGAEFLKADYEPAALADLWERQQPDDPMRDLGGVYQSVLSGLQWTTPVSSPFLRALREATRDELLSIKFNLYGVSIEKTEAGKDGLSLGRIVGSIGIHRTGEPWQFVAARRLRRVPRGVLNNAPCMLDENSGTLFIDLGNSVPTTSVGGPPIPLGPLRLAALVGEEAPRILAPLEGLEGDYYPNRAAIATARLTPDQVATALTSRLAVVDGGDPPKQMLAENADATYVRADNLVFRLYPGTPDNRATSTLFVTQFGRPAAEMLITVTGGRKIPPLDYPITLTTDGSGRAEFWMSSGEPSILRPYIDGISRRLFYRLGETSDEPPPDEPPSDEPPPDEPPPDEPPPDEPPPDEPPPDEPPDEEPEGIFEVRVFYPFEVPDRPTWVRDIQPIFQRYANLYPAMQMVFDLGNYNHVVKYRNVIRASLLLPPTSPDYMPVSRDLSPGKRDMIVKWLDSAPQPPVLDIDSPDALRMVLQQALLLEQAVMPPYLAALFSIKASRNIEIAEIISGVVREEMLHMALAGNLLSAVGGKPQIGRPGLVPTYPGRLPAPVLPDLTVRLRRCSIEHIRDVFLKIEQPQHPVVAGRVFTGPVIDRKSVNVDSRGKVLSADQSEMGRLADFFNNAEYEPMTIGWFYTQIARAIWRLNQELAGRGETLFTGDPARQVNWPTAPGTLYRITDVQSALLAIYEIIEQGEGSPLDLDGDLDPDRLGHYYRFLEIVQGRYLIRNSAGKWVFEGAPIRFDPDGVYPMVDDPDAYRLAAESVARRESELFNEMYTNLLTSLNLVFDGHPEELSDAVALMFSLQVQAKKLFDHPTSPGAGTVVGPAFQSPGVVLG